MSTNENSTGETIILSILHFIGSIWNTVTFFPWYFLTQNFRIPKLGKVQAKSINGKSSGPYRNIDNISSLYNGSDNCKTIDSLFERAVHKHGGKHCLGTRELLEEHDEIQPNGRVFKKVILGEYKWLTFQQCYEHVRRISSGVKALGTQAKEYVLIFAETKAEWMLTAQACFFRNFPVVTIYATLGDEGLVFGFNQVEAKVIFTDAALLPKLKNLISQLHFVETIVYYGDVKKSLIKEFPAEVSVYSLQQIEDLGSKLRNINVPVETPEPDDVAVVMYTSGSTGTPKGVIISHENLISSLNGVFSSVPELIPTDRYIGYLPLAHIFELITECAVLSKGLSIGYSNALTLSDQSSKIKKGSKGDITVLKPTIMIAVPMILDRIRKSIMDKVNSEPRKKILFQFAYEYKLNQVKGGFDTPLLNRFIFKKIAMIFGGELRLMLCGGAPLSPQTEEFLQVCFTCPVEQGYGLTETCAGATVSTYWDTSVGRVGRPVGCCDIKLVNWEEGNYLTTDKPYPRGEIVIGGKNVARGYIKLPEQTEQVFKHEDGRRWFYTGDIGEMHPDGVLKVIDRKKDLVKLAHGEYISLGKVETAMKDSAYIDNCCAYGDGNESYLVLLVVPNVPALHRLAEELGIIGSFVQLCADKRMVQALLKDVAVTAKKASLNKMEIPGKLKICEETWLPESNLVTAAFKLKRKCIETFYQRDLEMLYLN